VGRLGGEGGERVGGEVGGGEVGLGAPLSPENSLVGTPQCLQTAGHIIV